MQTRAGGRSPRTEVALVGIASGLDLNLWLCWITRQNEFGCVREGPSQRVHLGIHPSMRPNTHILTVASGMFEVQTNVSLASWA